jgi:tRNA-uridine 2-sulfurtransferase
MNASKKKTVAVGMSGGIDSTVAALLLTRQGYHVLGLSMKIWDESLQHKGTRSGCYGPGEARDIADAQKVAERLGIEHHVVDLKETYKETVIEYFQKEYTCGRTPNPCVVCNSRMKFGALLERALAAGIDFDFFATGHYALTVYDSASKRYALLRGIDRKKDQSYFLYRLTQAQLSKIMFPLGHYRKDEVRTIARESGFEDWLKKPESQDFLEWDDYGTLIENAGLPGNILDADGNIIGTHRGIAFYTVGQRKMLNLSGMKEPHYVLRIDAERNEITAGPKRGLLKDSLLAVDVYWIIPPEERHPGPVCAKIRSTAALTECRVFPEPDNKATIKFAVPQESITPGQSVVFYAGDMVLGGGIIQESPAQ